MLMTCPRFRQMKIIHAIADWSVCDTRETFLMKITSIIVNIWNVFVGADPWKWIVVEIWIHVGFFCTFGKFILEIFLNEQNFDYFHVFFQFFLKLFKLKIELHSTKSCWTLTSNFIDTVEHLISFFILLVTCSASLMKAFLFSS